MSQSADTVAALLQYGKMFNIDPRLVVAIAGQETTFGTYDCAPYNAWNWFWCVATGTCSNSDPPITRCEASPFASWSDGIQTVTRGLRRNYLNKGFNSIALIGSKYCGEGCATWVPNVTTFYSQLAGDLTNLQYSCIAPAPPPTAINIQQLWPQFTTGSYVGIFWTPSSDSNFAAYDVRRATSPGVSPSATLVAHITNPLQIYLKDNSLLPGSYFYRIFAVNSVGEQIGGSELSARVFGPADVITVIPGVPEPGDTSYPPSVAIPQGAVPQVYQDCPRDIYSPFSCLGPFAPISLAVDVNGDVKKVRSFAVTISGGTLSGITTLQFILLSGDNFQCSFTATDDTYTVAVPALGLQLSIPQGQTRFMGSQVTAIGDSSIVLTTASTGATRTAGTITVVP